MFELCIFDLDETLLRTDDLKAVREAGKNNKTDAYLQGLRVAWNKRTGRLIYSREILDEIRTTFPKLHLAVFTRSPRSYANAVLEWAYPGFYWDIVVGYEDVKRTKPYGEGIDLARQACLIFQLDKVILVGDGDNDVRAAYNAGCRVVLDKSAWPQKRENDHWNALGHVPDAIIEEPREIIDVLTDFKPHLPELERLLLGTNPSRQGWSRFDKINHFIPREIENTRPFPIFCAGRSFAGYPSLASRRKWHKLTKELIDQKEAELFPEAWVRTVRNFIADEFPTLVFAGKLIVTTIPHRPGREPRLEKFLDQIADSYKTEPHKRNLAISFVPNVFAYKDGVRSNSNDKLRSMERFKNVRDHLYVVSPDTVERATQYLVIDDIATTGSSLIYAAKYLANAGATRVTCLSLAKNISDVL